jgi:hypothetical protein
MKATNLPLLRAKIAGAASVSRAEHTSSKSNWSGRIGMVVSIDLTAYAEIPTSKCSGEQSLSHDLCLPHYVTDHKIGRSHKISSACLVRPHSPYHDNILTLQK